MCDVADAPAPAEKKKELRLESSHQSAAITGALLQEILCIRRDVSFLILLLLHHSMDFSSFFLLLSVKERSSVSAVLCLLPKDYVSLLGPGHHLSRQNNKSNTRQSEWTHWTAEEECLAFWPIKCNVIKIKEASEKRKERIDLFYFPFLACVPPPLSLRRPWEESTTSNLLTLSQNDERRPVSGHYML